MKRRQFIERLSRTAAVLAAGTASTHLVPSFLFAVEGRPAKRLGIGMHSYGFQWKAAKANPVGAKFFDALTFVKYAKQMGAGGVQVAIGQQDSAYARRVREEAESSGMFFEAQTALPQNQSETTRFETDVRLAKEAGANVMRTALLSGRRYETFDSAEAFRSFRERSWHSLTLAEPILRRHRLRLAIENHKDWLVPELLEWLRQISSEWIGVCVDFGNSIALLENPMEVVEAYAPFAATTHIKDMAVQEYAEGFLLSEVPLGSGFLDLTRMIAVLAKANPQIQFNLEMITRDPLKVPCLTGKYWATMSSPPASRLAGALAMVRQRASRAPLPQAGGLMVEAQLALEDENVRRSLAFGSERLLPP